MPVGVKGGGSLAPCCLGEPMTPAANATAMGVAAVLVLVLVGAVDGAALSASSDPLMRRRVLMIWSDRRRVDRLTEAGAAAVPVTDPLDPLAACCTLSPEEPAMTQKVWHSWLINI